MEVMGITQERGSLCMIIVGVFELISRCMASWLGDYIKGKILYLYIGCMLAMSCQNAMGYFATTYSHLALYGAGKRTIYTCTKITESVRYPGSLGWSLENVIIPCSCEDKVELKLVRM